MDNLYKILQVEPDASQKEIKLAYRELAFRHHPDRNPGNADSEDTFKEVGQAYEILGNKRTRRQYDRSLASHGLSDFIQHVHRHSEVSTISYIIASRKREVKAYAAMALMTVPLHMGLKHFFEEAPEFSNVTNALLVIAVMCGYRIHSTFGDIRKMEKELESILKDETV